MSIDGFRACMKVKLLPAFKAQMCKWTYAGARIMNVVSAVGMISAGSLTKTAYKASETAVEAFTDSLRMEMMHFGITVVVVNR